MSQMNPKEVFDNTAYSVQLPYIAGHYLSCKVYIAFMCSMYCIYLYLCVFV